MARCLKKPVLNLEIPSSRFRDVHSAAVAVRSVRLQDRVNVNGPQVSHRPGGDAARLARRWHAWHPAARCRCTGKHKLQLQITQRVHSEI